MKSANASTGRSLDGKKLEVDQRTSTGKVRKPQLTASGRLYSKTDSSKNDETRYNITNEGGYLKVNEKKSDRQTHTHHSSMEICNKNSMLNFSLVLYATSTKTSGTSYFRPLDKKSDANRSLTRFQSKL